MASSNHENELFLPAEASLSSIELLSLLPFPFPFLIVSEMLPAQDMIFNGE